MENRRVLILMADEHSTKMLGCQGNPDIKTPNLDRLAGQGTLFSAAYCNSPICVPARAAFATGRYVHETGCWDNAFGYEGQPPSWGHLLSANGVNSYSIGKLHYKNEQDDTGFTQQILPMHLVNGVGDVLGCVRDPLPRRHKSKSLATDIGPGESDYNKYDRSIAAAACDWIQHNADESWVLFVSFVAPHFPLICPPEFYQLYDPAKVKLPKLHKPEEWPQHPWVSALRECFGHDDHFKDDDQRRIAIASYMGLCTFIDHQMGMVLNALEAAGIGEDTLVLYTSDHGDNLGSRGLWGKSVMYEESAAVPMIMRTPGRAGGTRTATAVSHLDIAPTLTDWFGVTPDPQWRGDSLLTLAAEPDDDSRVVLSEYHAVGARSAAFMIRQGKWKLVWYADAPTQLFDLESDPEELVDLGADAGFANIRDALTGRLFAICDPVAIDKRAKHDQAVLVEQHGGARAVVERGGFGATPAPGTKAVFAGLSSR
jgi:choline-sulfatase